MSTNTKTQATATKLRRALQEIDQEPMSSSEVAELLACSLDTAVKYIRLLEEQGRATTAMRCGVLTIDAPKLTDYRRFMLDCVVGVVKKHGHASTITMTEELQTGSDASSRNWMHASAAQGETETYKSGNVLHSCAVGEAPAPKVKPLKPRRMGHADAMMLLAAGMPEGGELSPAMACKLLYGCSLDNGYRWLRKLSHEDGFGCSGRGSSGLRVFRQEGGKGETAVKNTYRGITGKVLARFGDEPTSVAEVRKALPRIRRRSIDNSVQKLRDRGEIRRVGYGVYVAVSA